MNRNLLQGIVIAIQASIEIIRLIEKWRNTRERRRS